MKPASTLCSIVFVFSAPAWAQNKVAVERAETRDLPATMRLVGTVEPSIRSVIGAEVSGLVQEMPVRQGDRVEAGGVICKLKDDILVAELNAAKARLSALQARLDELLAGTRSEELARLRAELAETKAVFQRWTAEQQRIALLHQAHRANEKEVYETEAEYHAAEQRMLAAQARFDEAESGPRPEVIAQARFDVAEQQAVVDRHERDLAHATIRAPFTGYVTRLDTEVGQWVERGGRIVELIELNRLLVRVNAPETAIAYIKIDDAARVLVEALSEELTGRIRHVIPQADIAARTFPVQIELANEQGRLKSGMIAWATVTSGPAAQTVAVPKDAVDLRGGVSYVCVVAKSEKGYQATPTRVTTGADIGEWIAITSGNIAPGDVVATRGNERILFPESVEVTNPDVFEALPSAAEAGDRGGG